MQRHPWYQWLPFVLPYAVYVLISTVEPLAPHAYPVIYTVKALLTACAMAWAWSRLPLQSRPTLPWIMIAVISGFVLTVMWVGLDSLVRHPGSGGMRMGFDPYTIHSAAARAAFVAVRIVGLVLLVPIFEEVLYRGFLLRVVEDSDDFQRVPIGTLRPIALLVNVGMFSLTHPEHVAAAVFALAMCGLVARSRNLWVPITAHAVTNFALALYVLETHRWYYW